MRSVFTFIKFCKELCVEIAKKKRFFEEMSMLLKIMCRHASACPCVFEAQHWKKNNGSGRAVLHTAT